MWESASPRALAEVPEQNIDYRIVDNRQLGAIASGQNMQLSEGGLGKLH